MQNFNYHRPKSIDDALAALEKAEDGKLMAGGQSLIPLMKLNLAAPSDVISLGDIDALKGIRTGGGRLVVGAATTHTEVGESETVRKAIPALARLAAGIGDPQVRNRGTLGGSIAHNDPAADYPAALVALDATVKTNRREIKADEFFTGVFETALEENELITEVSFAVPQKAAYAKFRHPSSRFAIVGVMVARHESGVRVAVVGAGENVFRVAAMEKALAENFTAEAVAGIQVPEDGLAADLHASAEYRAHLITVMAKRAVAACAS